MANHNIYRMNKTIKILLFSIIIIIVLWKISIFSLEYKAGGEFAGEDPLSYGSDGQLYHINDINYAKFLEQYLKLCKQKKDKNYFWFQRPREGEWTKEKYVEDINHGSFSRCNYYSEDLQSQITFFLFNVKNSLKVKLVNVSPSYGHQADIDTNIYRYPAFSINGPGVSYKYNKKIKKVFEKEILDNICSYNKDYKQEAISLYGSFAEYLFFYYKDGLLLFISRIYFVSVCLIMIVYVFWRSVRYLGKKQP